jgi:uncharacterized protein (DUF1501 family)
MNTNQPFMPARRQWMAAGLSLSAGALLPGRVWAQRPPAGALSRGRLVVVFLRGAYDGLSALVPYSDRDYYALRPNLAIPAPDGSRETALKLDDRFALHPALAPLLPLWQEGVMGAIASAGLPTPNRSHFDAQHFMELGTPEKSGSPVGWLNKLSANSAGSALGVGEANPAILAGQASVKLIPRGESAVRTGVLANESQRSALLDLYAGEDRVSQAFRQGAGSRIQTSKELLSERSMRTAANAEKANAMNRRALDQDGTPQTTAAQQAQMQAASNGAADPVGLALDALHLATLMRNDPQLRLGFLSAGGWDTHANQGNVKGQLANNLGNLARGLAQLRGDFDQPGDLIVVMSEFGRTAAENGTQGTDHGFGNAMWLIGNRVQGGKVHGQWSGLARGSLNDNRDLPAHHDYRAVLAQALRSTFALPDSQLQALLPGSNWDTRLDRVFRRA